MPDSEKRRWNYFSDDEVKNLDIELIAKLDMARHRAGIPFFISSGYRDPEHNFAVGGVSDSSHCHVDVNGNPNGLAVDLICRTSNELWHMLDGLYYAGFKRIGVYFICKENIPFPNHIHVDSDMRKPQEVVFLKWEGMPGQVNS